MPIRHDDNGSTLYRFADRFLVVCPRCDRCAVTSPIGKQHHIPIARLVCVTCGHTHERQASGWLTDIAEDWYFQLPLWLQCSCAGNRLWAYNLEHLAYLESYVRATLRLRGTQSQGEARNATLASRLPRWMTSAKNRQEVLKAIKTLRGKLPA